MSNQDFVSDVDRLLAALDSTSSDQIQSGPLPELAPDVIDQIFDLKEETIAHLQLAGVVPGTIAEQVPAMKQQSVAPPRGVSTATRPDIGILGKVKNLLRGKPKQRSPYRQLALGQQLEPRMALDTGMAAEVRYPDAEGEFAPQTESLSAELAQTKRERNAAQAALDAMLAPTTETVRETVTVPADPVSSGMIEAYYPSYGSVQNAGIESSRRPDLQVGQQYWLWHDAYFGWRVLLDFDLKNIPKNAKIEKAVLTVQGAKKLNVTNENDLALNVVGVALNSAGKPNKFGSASLGEKSYPDFIIGEKNAIQLSSADLSRGGDDRLRFGLRISQDLKNVAPSRSGNNAYVFFIGNVADPLTAPGLQLTYTAEKTKSNPASAAELQLQRAKIAALDAKIEELMKQLQSACQSKTGNPETTIDACLNAIAKEKQALEFIKTADALLSRIDVLTQPWDISGQANRLKLLNDRAALLNATAKELMVVGSTLPPLLMLVNAKEPVDLQNLSERIQIAALRLAAAIGEWQREQTVFDAEPWQMLSAASRERLFTNNAPGMPALAVTNLSGPNATVFFAGSTEGRTLQLFDPGVFGTKTVFSAQNGKEEATTLTMNAVTPNGIYAVQLFDAQKKELSSLQLHWNQETKTLSLVNANNKFVPTTTMHDDGSLPYAELFTQAKSEEDRQAIVAGQASAKEQLFSGVASAIPTGYVPDFNMNLSKIFRENAQMQLMQLATLSGINFTLTIEQEMKGFLELNPEYKRIGSGSFEADKGYFFNQFHRKFDGYYQAAAELLQKSMDSILAARQGKNIDTLQYWRGLHTIVDNNNYGQQLFTAKLAGVVQPNATTMFGAVQAIYDKQFNEFLAFQDSTYKEMRARQEEFKNWQPAVSAAGSASSQKGMTPHESERMMRAKVKARDAAMERGVRGNELQMYNREVILAQENNQKVLGGTVVYAYGAPRDGAKINFETVAGSEGTGTVEERILAHVKAYPAAKKFLAGLPALQQESIATLYLANNPTDTSFLENLSPAVQEKVRITLAKAESLTVKLSAGLENMTRELVEGISYFPTTLRPAYNVYPYGDIPSEGKTDDPNIPIAPRGLEMITFTLKERMMVNLSTAAADMGEIEGALLNESKPNIDFKLFGKEHPETFYSTNKRVSGESISRVLKPGTYYLIISDATSYKGLTSQEMKHVRLPAVPVELEFKKFNSANIEGKISLEGDPRVMPVSMRVAEFISDGNGGMKRNTNYHEDPQNGGVSQLKPNLPVWVVVHGRVDSEKGDAIAELAKNLSDRFQVVTIDWQKAAADNGISPISLSGSAWIPSVGNWVAQQLQSLGFTKTNVNIAVHSWGAYVAYETAKTFGGVNSIVALDPAEHNKYLGGQYSPEKRGVDFSAFASHSYSLHSSQFGNVAVPKSAEHAFTVNAANEGYEFWVRLNADGLNAKTLRDLMLNVPHASAYLRSMIPDLTSWYLGSVTFIPDTLLSLVDAALDAYREHGFAVTAFSNLIGKERGTDASLNAISIDNIMKGPAHDNGQGNYDGSMIVDVMIARDSNNKEWWKASAKNIRPY